MWDIREAMMPSADLGMTWRAFANFQITTARDASEGILYVVDNPAELTGSHFKREPDIL